MWIPRSLAEGSPPLCGGEMGDAADTAVRGQDVTRSSAAECSEVSRVCVTVRDAEHAI